MKRMAFALWLVATPAVMAQDRDPGIQQAFDSLASAWAAGDADAWSRLVDENATITHADGHTHVKPDEVEHVRSGQSKMSRQVDASERVTFTRTGNGLTRRYVAESGLITEFWRKLPSGGWVLTVHADGFGKRPVLTGTVRP